MRDYSRIRINWKSWKNKTAWKLVNENWRLAHEIVELRDGYACVIPGCGEVDYLQLDHAISRQCRGLFFETENLNYLCGAHHTHKSNRKGQWVDKMVDQITIQRAGEHWWDWAITEGKKPCPSFQSVWYQEQANIKLKEERAMMKAYPKSETNKND